MLSIESNSPQVWDKVWNDKGIVDNDQLILATEKQTIRWHKMKQHALKNFKKLNNLKILEIGSGKGTYAALFASEGCRATILDYSDIALKKAQNFFVANQLKVKTVRGDALNISKVFGNQKFDIVISIGLTEHFKGLDRVKIHQAHLKVLSENGLTFIAVPNAYNPPYRIFKFFSEIFGTWKFGEEYPFTKKEIRFIAKKINAEVVDIFGDELYSSIKFLLPANFLRRFFKVGTPKKVQDIRPEKSSFLDDELGYSLTMVLKRINQFSLPCEI